MRVFIHAYEDFYEGLHGVEDFAVLEVADEDEAYEVANELSIGVIESYGMVEQYASIDDYDIEDEYWEELDQIIQDYVAYDIFKVKDGVTLSNAELEHKVITEGFVDEFISTYCEEF